MSLNFSILTFILALPLLGAIALMFIPRTYGFLIRVVALGTTFGSMLLAILMFARFVPGKEGYQFVASYDWVRALGITLKIGVDGLNVGLVLMGAIVAFAA